MFASVGALAHQSNEERRRSMLLGTFCLAGWDQYAQHYSSEEGTVSWFDAGIFFLPPAPLLSVPFLSVLSLVYLFTAQPPPCFVGLCLPSPPPLIPVSTQ